MWTTDNAARFGIRAAAASLAALGLAIAGCSKPAPLPAECEAELRLMACVADHLTAGPTRPDVRAARRDLERQLSAKGVTSLAAQCRSDTASLRLTSSRLCATEAGGGDG